MSLLRSPTPSTSAVCSSCKETLLEDQDCIIISQCAHSFHRLCIASYSECPTCKKPFELSDLRNLNTQNENPQSVNFVEADVRNLSLQKAKAKNAARGRGRGANAKQYNTTQIEIYF